MTTHKPFACTARGFTLIEMLVVLAVGAIILAGALVFASQTRTSNAARETIANMQTIVAKIRMLNGNRGNYDWLNSTILARAGGIPHGFKAMDEGNGWHTLRDQRRFQWWIEPSSADSDGLPGGFLVQPTFHSGACIEVVTGNLKTFHKIGNWSGKMVTTRAGGAAQDPTLPEIQALCRNESDLRFMTR